MKNLLTASLALTLLAGCAAVERKPVLYPNTKFKQVGEVVAQRDVAECEAAAKSAGAGDGTGPAARGAAQGAAVGAATAAVGSLIRGGNVLEGAAAGAAIGGTAGGVSGAFQSGEGSSVYRNFVGRCLRERGYDVIGWQ